MRKSYVYVIMTLADARKRDQVFVPNCSAEEAIQIWRYLAGLRKDFPRYNDHDMQVVGIDEQAWCSPKEYLESFAPSTMTCIVRHPT